MEARYEIFINRSPGDVFDCLADVTSWPKWSSLTHSVEVLERSQGGDPTRFRAAYLVDTITYEVIESTRPTTLVVKVVEGGISADIQYSVTCRAERDGTVFANDFIVRLAGIRMLLAPQLALSMRKRVRTDGKDLRNYLESS